MSDTPINRRLETVGYVILNISLVATSLIFGAIACWKIVEMYGDPRTSLPDWIAVVLCGLMVSLLGGFVVIIAANSKSRQKE